MREFWSGTRAAMEPRWITLAVKINVCTGNESSKNRPLGPDLSKLLRLRQRLTSEPLCRIRTRRRCCEAMLTEQRSRSFRKPDSSGTTYLADNAWFGRTKKKTHTISSVSCLGVAERLAFSSTVKDDSLDRARSVG